MDADDAELEASARARIGIVLRDKYRIESVIGVGGMAVVYRATHRNQAEFAIKMLHPELSVRESLRKRFLREGYAANSVKHPGVVTIVDDDVAEDGAAFLVMELLHGSPIDALIERNNNRLPVPVACAILDQLLDVLAAAHEKGVIHRDIKPANLFLTDDGTLKVLDFGIARVRDVLSTDSNATGTGVLLGTPSYMSPEQARGATHEIDARTDLWAAAATFFTLVSGQTVHAATNSAQMLIAAATAVPRSITTVADMRDSVARVIDRALSFQSSERFKSATEMRAALRAATAEAFGAPPSRSLLVDRAIEVASARVGVAPTVASPTEYSQPVLPTTPESQPIISQAVTTTSKRSIPAWALVLAIVFAAGAVVVVKTLTRTPVTSQPEAVADITQPSASAPTSAASSIAPALQPSIVPTHSPVTHPTARPHPINCDPPYYVDSENRKIFRKECL